MHGEDLAASGTQSKMFAGEGLYFVGFSSPVVGHLWKHVAAAIRCGMPRLFGPARVARAPGPRAACHGAHRSQQRGIFFDARISWFPFGIAKIWFGIRCYG